MISLEFPKFRITSYAWEKFWAYIDIAKGEIGGLGKMEISPGFLTVSDIFVFEQSASAAHFVLDPAALSKFGRGILERGEKLMQYRLWWHSHAEFAVGWSPDKDEVTIERLSRETFLVSIVGNKNAEMATRYDIQTPFHLVIHNFGAQILTVPEKLDLNALEDEVASKVRIVKSPGIKIVRKAG
jgi:hypothetical protein